MSNKKLGMFLVNRKIIIFSSISVTTHYPNKTEDDLYDSTDNSHTENEVSVNKLNVKKGEDKDD